MLNKLDALYFWMRDHYRGLVQGECKSHEQGYAAGWDEGFDNGIVSTRLAVLNKLDHQNPKLSNPEFTLGFNHAVAIVKGDVN